MASHTSLVRCGLFLVISACFVQSAPIDKPKQIVPLLAMNNKPAVSQHLPEPVTSTTVAPSTIGKGKHDQKVKRNIFDESDGEDEADPSSYFALDNTDDQIDHKLHALTKETPATVHDATDKTGDADDSQVFSDLKMNPTELTDIVRRRRDVKSNDESSRRRKRALSPYDFYDADSFYDPYADLAERTQYVRPTRSFAPVYWYPSMYERNVRSALPSSFFEPLQDSRAYSDSEDTDDSDESPVTIFDDEYEKNNDYELNRYPILLESSNNPYDNLQLQQSYNTDDLPVDEIDEQDEETSINDGDEQNRFFYPTERPYYTRYGPFETYFE